MPENMDQTICPAMSDADETVFCGTNCELFNEQFSRCSWYLIGQLAGLQAKEIIDLKMAKERNQRTGRL